MSRPLTPQDIEFLRQLNLAHPATEATPYNKRAETYDDQAASLDRQAATPYPRPRGIGEHIVEGLRAGMENFGRLGAPGGYYGQEARRQEQFADENKVRASRAQALRNSAQQEREQGATVVQRGTQNRLNQEQIDETAGLRKIQQGELDLKREAADKPTIHSTPMGSRTDAFDSKGIPIPNSTVEGAEKPVTEKNQGFRDAVNAKGETVREYFDQSDPSTVTYSENLGVKRTPENSYSGKVQVQYTGDDGKPHVGTLDKATNTITPATIPGQNGAPVQNATAGNTNVRAGAAATVDLVGAERLYKTMQDTLSRIESGKSSAPGADDMVLLSNHIAMTFGTVKGARMGKDLIEAHLKARSLPDSLSVIAQHLLNGEQLTPGQRREFVSLAERRVNEMKQSRQDLDSYFGAAAPAAQPGAPAGNAPRRIRVN